MQTQKKHKYAHKTGAISSIYWHCTSSGRLKWKKTLDGQQCGGEKRRNGKCRNSNSITALLPVDRELRIGFPCVARSHFQFYLFLENKELKLTKRFLNECFIFLFFFPLASTVILYSHVVLFNKVSCKETPLTSCHFSHTFHVTSFVCALFQYCIYTHSNFFPYFYLRILNGFTCNFQGRLAMGYWANY